MHVLAVGIDNLEDDYSTGMADVIRIARLDFVNGNVTTLALPRDLWVAIPGLADHGISEGLLSQSFTYGTEELGYYEGSDFGPGLLIETLKLNYGLEIDRYITLNMETFEKVIDAVDGIDLDLPYDVDGESTDPADPFDLGYFEQGEHHFDGETAVTFTRIRMMDDDYQRLDRQAMVLEALWEKLVSPTIWTQIPDLISALQGSVEMNLIATDIQQMLCLAPEVSSEDFVFTNLPRELLTESSKILEGENLPLFYWEVDEQTLIQLLENYQTGTWPNQNP
jgi:LCP family protein required for cell wall assembly